MTPHARWILLIVAAHTAPAYAYLDPATGSLLLQGLFAALAGIAVTAKLYWAKLKRLFGFAPREDADEAPPSGAEVTDDDAERR